MAFAVGREGTVAALDLLSHTVDFVLQPPFACQPHELALDASRGFLAVLCYGEEQVAERRAQEPAGGSEVSSRPRLRPGTHALLIWDLHSQSLDSVRSGSDARHAFSHFKQCLRTHYAAGSTTAAPADAARTLARHATFSHAASPTSTSRLSGTDSMSTLCGGGGSGGMAAGGERSPSPRKARRSIDALRSALHMPVAQHRAAHGAATPADDSDIDGTATVPTLRVSAASPCAALGALAAPLPNLLLLHVDLEALLHDPEQHAEAQPPMLGEWHAQKQHSLKRQTTHDMTEPDERFLRLCEALALLHRWGVKPSAGVRAFCLLLVCTQVPVAKPLDLSYQLQLAAAPICVGAPSLSCRCGASAGSVTRHGCM